METKGPHEEQQAGAGESSRARVLQLFRLRSVVSHVGAEGAVAFPQHPSCFLHLRPVVLREAVACGAIWSGAIKATFCLISFATCVVIPALRLELLIIIHYIIL